MGGGRGRRGPLAASARYHPAPMPLALWSPFWIDFAVAAGVVCLGVGVALFLVLRLAFVATPTAWARWRSRSALRRARGAARRARRDLGAHESALDGEAVLYARANAERKLGALALEELRDEGAARVRFGALAEAGYRSLADVEGVPAAQLAEVSGVGETTAPRLAEAAARAIERIRGEEPQMIGPDLDGLAEPRAEELALAALRVLETADVVAAPLARVETGLEEHREELARLRADTRFVFWLRRVLRRRDGARRHAHRALTDAAAVARAWSRGAEVAELERALDVGRELELSEELDRGRFGERYAEICARIEASFVRVGLRPADRSAELGGGLPAEIARRVEAFPLDAGGLDLTLRGYQVFGAKYLLAQERTVLGDEMGLGKTIEVLAAMQHVWDTRRANDRSAHFVVLAPAGLIWNWEREIARRAGFPAHVLHGGKADEGVLEWAARGGAAITSYATLRALELDETILGTGTRVAVLAADEAHYLKNPDAERTRRARRLIESAEVVCLMTGTPLENRPAEFLELIRTVRRPIADELEKRSAAEEGVDPRHFHRAAAAVYLRRNQTDVLRELPPRIDHEEWIELGAEEERGYRAALERRDFAGLRRAATVTARAGEVPRFTSSKLDHLADLLEEHREEGRKVLVFSFFLAVLEAVEERFGPVGTISGSTSPKARMELVDRFGDQPGHALLALQIDAGGVGLNLQAASVVVLMEPQLKPTVEEQAVARAHRMGQMLPVLVHRLLARGTVDERLLELLDTKRDLFEAFARDSAVKSASPEATDRELALGILEAERERWSGGSSTAAPASS